MALLADLFDPAGRVELQDGGHLDVFLKGADAVLESTLVDKLVTVHGPHGTFERHQKVSADAGAGGTDVRTSERHPDPDHVLAGLNEALANAAPGIEKKPGLLHRIGDAALTAAAKVNLFLLKHHGAIEFIGKRLGDVLDTPDDMKKFGYNPSLSGGGHATSYSDPVKDQLGISTHLACTIASHVLAKAINYAKSRGRAESVLESDEEDWLPELADVIQGVLKTVNEALGLEGLPETNVIIAALKKQLNS